MHIKWLVYDFIDSSENLKRYYDVESVLHQMFDEDLIDNYQYDLVHDDKLVMQELEDFLCWCKYQHKTYGSPKERELFFKLLEEMQK